MTGVLQPMIAGLDVATSTGVCFGRVGEKPQFLSQRFKGDDTDFMGIVEAVEAAMVWTIGFIKTVRPDYLVIEAPLEFTPSAGTARTTIKLTSLAINIAAVAKAKSVPVRFAKVSTVRRTLLGPGGGGLKGDHGKREVMRFCRAAGWEPATHDQSDAGAVWWFMGRELRPQIAQPMDSVSLGIAPVEAEQKRGGARERVRIAPKNFRRGDGNA